MPILVTSDTYPALIIHPDLGCPSLGEKGKLDQGPRYNIWILWYDLESENIKYYYGVDKIMCNQDIASGAIIEIESWWNQYTFS